MNTTRFVIPLLLLVFAGACGAGGRPPNTEPRPNSSTTISAQQLAGLNTVTAYDAVEKLRPQWLRKRGDQSITFPGAGVVVYLDDARYGDVSTLRGIQATLVSSIRYYDAAAAHYRFGMGHTHGVIQVVTIGAR